MGKCFARSREERWYTMIDRLISKIQQTENPTVVGLDPTLEMIPDYIKEEKFSTFRKTPKAVSEMFLAFNKGIIDAVCDLVPAVKPQIAMYEKYGIDGLSAYIDTIDYAKEKGLIVIGDIKRGDIASTAKPMRRISEERRSKRSTLIFGKKTRSH